MAQTMEKVNEPARIFLEGDASLKATVDAVLKKNRYANNIATNHSETAKRTDEASINLTLKNERLPDIERITCSLRKVQEIKAGAYLLWPNNKTAVKITSSTIKIINQACKRKFSFGNGKSFRCLLGGLFYLLGFRYNDPKKQRDIAIALQITDVSIRSSYKQWLKEFPDVFQDIIARFASQELRRNYYSIARSRSQTRSCYKEKNFEEDGFSQL
jgi:hypothetical protein